MIRSPLAHEFLASPNIEPRRGLAHPDMLILHYTGMEQASAARDWLCNPASGVSCHYLVDEKGWITQIVGDDMRAWHAGVSFWAGDGDINSRSIGIEIHNPGHNVGYPDFPDAQMRAVIALCQDICARHAIAPRHVLAHSDVAPGRKIDPGEKFDWARLHRAGVGHWVEPVAAEGEAAAAEVEALLREYGYGVANLEATIAAFQRHFRPARIDGVPDRSTLETLKRLIRACGTATAGLPHQRQ